MFVDHPRRLVVTVHAAAGHHHRRPAPGASSLQPNRGMLTGPSKRGGAGLMMAVRDIISASAMQRVLMYLVSWLHAVRRLFPLSRSLGGAHQFLHCRLICVPQCVASGCTLAVSLSWFVNRFAGLRSRACFQIHGAGFVPRDVLLHLHEMVHQPKVFAMEKVVGAGALLLPQMVDSDVRDPLGHFARIELLGNDHTVDLNLPRTVLKQPHTP
mmetsp:Transcript_13919/g.33592  ORF Transcript_13919/g.33592 Transcript_13919/m.33592 type:complete len:212 (-) Transcript_13919:131-766(-)